MAQEDAAAQAAPAGESGPGFPPQRDPETPAPPRLPEQQGRGEQGGALLPAQRPEPGAQGGGYSGESGTPEDQTQSPHAAQQDPDTSLSGPESRREPARESALGARERAVLDFERGRWKHAGAKEQAIRDTFDLSATRYYQILNALLDDPAALAYAPALVSRLRRIRDARREARH